MYLIVFNLTGQHLQNVYRYAISLFEYKYRLSSVV